jgi:AAA family ATP:ADP antiporter
LLVSKKNLEAEYFYLLAALCKVGAGVVIILFSFKLPLVNKITSSMQYINAHNNYATLLGQSYLRSILLFAVLSGLALCLVNNIFYTIVRDKYQTTTQTIHYLANFLAILTVLGYLVSVLLSARVNNKYGYRNSLLILPVALSVFVFAYSVLAFRYGYNISDNIFYLMFMIMGIVKLLYTVVYRGIEFGTFRAYFIPVETERRFDFQSRTEGFFRYVGIALGGLLVIAVVGLTGASFRHFSWGLLAVSLGWVAATFYLHRLYRIKLKETLGSEGMPVHHTQNKIVSYIETLTYQATTVSAWSLPAHLHLLNILDPIQYKKAIELLLDSDDDDAQRIALYQAGDLCLLSAIPILEKVQRSKFYAASRNRELIRRTYNKLKGAEFRLEKIKYIEQLTFSKITSERRFGALLAAYSEASMKPKLLNKLFRDSDYKVRYHAVTAAACSETQDLYNNLIEKLADPAYSNAAVAACAATGDRMFGLLESAFYLTGQDEKVQLRIVQIYGRTGSEKAIELLMKKLNYTNQNIAQAALDALSRCGITITGDRSIQFRRELEEICQVLVWNMAAHEDLKKELTQKEDDPSLLLLLAAMKSEIKANYDSLFKMLALLYDPKSVALVKDNINSGDPDKADFAAELLEVFVSEEIKPMLMPLISVSTYDHVIWKMQEYFPADPMSIREVLYDLIQRDYKWVNRWTKACAMQALYNSKQYTDNDIFLANLVNPDPMLRETAAVILYQMDRASFKIYVERFKHEFNYQSGKEIISKNILSEISDTNESPALKFSMIRFLNHVDELKEVPGILLLEVAKIMECTSYKKGERIDYFQSFDYFDYFLVERGTVSMKIDGKFAGAYHQNQFIHALNYINTQESIEIELEATENCVVYKMRQENLHELFSYYEEIPKAILKHQALKEREMKQAMVIHEN